MGITQGGRSLRATRRASVGGELIIGVEGTGVALEPGSGGSPSGAADGPDITGTYPDQLALKPITGLSPGARVFPASVTIDGKGRVTAIVAGSQPLLLSARGAAGGVAGLGANQKILPENLPDGELNFKDTWDPSIASSRPQLVATGVQLTEGSDDVTTPSEGDIYIASSGMNSSDIFADGPGQRIRGRDWAIWVNNGWDHINRSSAGIASINGDEGPAVDFGIEDLDPNRSDLAKLNTVLGVTLDTAGTPRPPAGTVSGDLTGAATSPTLTKIMGRALATTAPLALQVLSWDPAAENGAGRIVWRTVGSVFATVQRFGTTVPAHVEPGQDMTAGNPYTIEYFLTHASQIARARLVARRVTPTPMVGSTVDTEIVASLPIQEGSNMATFNLPASFELDSAGDRIDLVAQFYRADETPADNANPDLVASESVTASAAPPAGHVYFGMVDPDNGMRPAAAASLLNDAGGASSLLQGFTKQSGDYTVPTYTGQKYLIYAFPQSQHDVLSLTIGASTNQIQGFTRTEDIEVGSPAVDYIFYISNQPQIGSTLSGMVVHIERRG